MAIACASELEAVINHSVIRIEKVIQERGQSDRLSAARDDLNRIHRLARDGERLKDARGRIDAVADTVSAEIPSDDDLLNDVWDMLDYVDYRA